MSDIAGSSRATQGVSSFSPLADRLRYHGRKRVHNANEYMAAIVAKRLVDHLGRVGFVVMKRPPGVGGSGPWSGAEE